MLSVASAQTSSTSVAAEPANTSTATSTVSAAEQTGVVPVVKYTGIMRGMGMDFSGAHQAENNDNAQLNFEQRMKFLAKASPNFEAGLEARMNVNFANRES